MTLSEARMDANTPLTPTTPSQLIQSETEEATMTDDNNDAVIVKELAYTIHSAMVKIRKRSISRSVLLKLIKAHFQLKSSRKAKHYLAELLRLEFINVAAFSAQDKPIYSIRMEAILSFS